MKNAFCFDLDGTITTTEVLPCIASELDLADEVATLTSATMQGHIPFEASFRLRCALLGSISPEKIRSIVADIPLEPNISNFIRENKDRCFVVTGNLDIWIAPLVEQLGCRLFSSHATYVEGRLRLSRILRKSEAIAQIRELPQFDRVIGIGDGANDVPMLEAADIGISFGGVHPPSQEAVFASQFISHEGSSLCRLLRAL